MKKLIFYLLLIITFQGLVFSQDTTIIKYYPLAPGNKWVYQRDQWFIPGPGKNSVKVDSTFVYNNHRYYVLKDIMYLLDGSIYSTSYSTQRVDSSTGNIYKFDSNGECLIDSLKSRVGDSALSCLAWTPADWFHCTDTSNYSLFGQNSKSKEFSAGGFEWGMIRQYAKNFGIVYKTKGAVQAFTTHYLRGCIINGVLHGDTTLTGIQLISSDIPTQFSLSQNYPNPFNPVTKIKFDIPPLSSTGEGPGVRLVIYDILGREIAVLVNDHLKPGKYELVWDGTNYPSGVYYYRLESQYFTLARKMLLIK